MSLPQLPLFSVATTFSDLQRYVAEQDKAINTLIDVEKGNTDTPCFTACNNAHWITVYKAIWGKGEATFQTIVDVVRDTTQRIDDSLLSEEVPDRCNAATKPPGLDRAWKFSCASFFIRPEYEEAQRAALSICGYNEQGSIPYNALLYSGHPGTGKSVCLLILLLRRLAAGLPTGLQIHADYAVLFWGGGVLNFGQNISASYDTLKGTGDPLSRIWMLVDLNQNLTQPTGAFNEPGPFFVVVATSPRRDRFQWAKKLDSCFFFYMKPWSFSEVLQARSLIKPNLPPSEQALWQLHVDYGPSPRHLFSNAIHPENYIADVKNEIRMVSPETLRTMLESAKLLSETSHFLIQIEPSPTSRYVPQTRVVTTRVFEMFWQIHQCEQLREMARFYDMCRRTPTTSAVDALFEFRVHQLLRAKRRISLVPILGHLKTEDKNVVYDDYRPKKRITQHVALPGSEVVTLTDGIVLTPGCYYRPRRGNDLPAINSLLLIKLGGESHVLLMFHITVNAGQIEMNKAGLEKVDDLIVPPNTKKILVAVIPKNVSPKIIVPREYLTDAFLALEDPNSVLPVLCYQLCWDSLFDP